MLTKISEINNLNDPIKQFQLEFQIALPDGKSEDADLGFKTRQLLLRAQSFSVPEIKMDDTTVNWAGHERKFAGKQTRNGDWTVEFTEVWSGDYIEGFRRWMTWAHDYVNGTISLHDNYMGSATVNILNPDKIIPSAPGAAAKQFFLKRLYPTQVNMSGTINPSSSDPVNISVTWHYDYFLMTGEEE